MDKIGKDELEFVVFCIENIGQKLGITGDQVYHLLTIKSHILEDYILPNYDILHTQGKEYIVEDIIEFMKEAGVVK